jgi:hypothetical protein
MASPAQITANRVNATRSTGPADTSKTRFNGVAHGLTSKQTVIAGESQQEYDTFATKLRKDLAPRSAVENVLVDRVIAAAWRMKRFERAETSFFNNRIEAYLQANPASDPDSALATLFTDPAEMARMRLFLRYQTATHREYDKAYKELKAAQVERSKKDREKMALGILDVYEEESALSASQTSVGFASQSAPALENTWKSATAEKSFTRGADFL